jgi:hypothetical protein
MMKKEKIFVGFEGRQEYNEIINKHIISSYMFENNEFESENPNLGKEFEKYLKNGFICEEVCLINYEDKYMLGFEFEYKYFSEIYNLLPNESYYIIRETNENDNFDLYINE